MDIQVIKVKDEEYALIPLKDLNRLLDKVKYEEKKWYSLDELFDEFDVDDTGVEFTVEQVADILNKSPEEIKSLIKDSSLVANKSKGKYRIRKTDLDAYLSAKQ